MRTISVLLFALVWLSGAWFGSWELNPNNSTRLFAAISLAERGDATIDEFEALTIDKARFGEHFFTDKAPGMTLMAAPWVALATILTGETSAGQNLVIGDPDFERFLRARIRLATAMTSALLTALAALCLFALGRGLTGSIAAGVFAALGFAMGTPVWGWSTTLFGHAPVASLLVIAVWAIWRGLETPARRISLALLAGIALGWAVVIEFPAALYALAIGLWALLCLRRLPVADARGAVIVAVAGGLLALVPLVAYNMLAFGTPIRFGYSGVVGFEGMNQGFFGLTYPKFDVLWEITFGLRRGLIWVAPVLILAPLGLARLIADRATRDLGWLAVALIGIALLYNASYVYWDGGHSTGPRHSVPAFGFLALGLAPFWAGARDFALRLIAVQLLALSMFLNLAIAASEIVAPDTYGFPIWQRVFVEMFFTGFLRTFPSEWLGWSVWWGLALYLLIAAVLMNAILILLYRHRAASNI